MKGSWKVLVPALALALTLTACGGRNTGGTTENGGTANNGAGNSAVGGGTADNGTVSDGTGVMDGRMGGVGSNGDVISEDTPAGPLTGSVSPGGNTTAHRRTAYDYLKDSRYSADDDGQVNGSWDPAARDFTQGARDLVRDAGDAVGDMGRDMGRAVGDVGRNVRNAVRDMTE